MKRTPKRILSYSLLFMFWFVLGTVQAQDAPPAAPGSDGNDEDIEALARGPVHEAFASQVNNDPEPGMIVEKAPPEVVDEVPPDYKPDGDNVVWIPGYWGFDDEREDYVWISGVWRTPPAGRRWVPGYWNELTDGKHQWVTGFWQATERRRVDYRGAPPESLESGPAVAAPSDNYFWTPGVWVYRGQGYRWRPGFWLRHRPDYTYTPSRWVWTPGGYVFVDGYWDYGMAARGVLFAPVIVRSPLVRYRPSVVIDVGRFHMHWFVRPRYSHYYFGDFYDAHYLSQMQIYPHHHFHLRVGYDPFYAYNHVHFHSRFGISYYHHVHHWHNYFNTNHLHRPARTFGMQLSLHNHGGNRHFGLSIYAHRLNSYRVQNDVNRRFVQVGVEHRNAAAGNSTSYFRLGYERSKLEGRVATGLVQGPGKTTSTKTGSWTLPQVERGTNVTVGLAQRHVREVGNRVQQVAKAVPTAAPGTTNRIVSRSTASIPRTPGASGVNPRPSVSSSLPSRVTIGGVNGNSRLPSRPGTSPTFPSRAPSGTVPSRVNPSSPRPTVPKPSVSPRPSVTPSVPRPSAPSPRPSVSPPRPRPSVPSPRPSVTPSAPRPSAPSPRPSVSPPRPRPSVPSPRPSVTPSAPRPSTPSPRPSAPSPRPR